VGRRFRGSLGADDGAGAWPILHHEWFFERLVQLFGNCAGEHISRAAQPERHDHLYRPGRIVLRQTRRGTQDKQNEWPDTRWHRDIVAWSAKRAGFRNPNRLVKSATKQPTCRTSPLARQSARKTDDS